MEQDPLVSTPEGVFHVTPGDEALHTALGIAKKQTFKSHIVRVGADLCPTARPMKLSIGARRTGTIPFLLRSNCGSAQGFFLRGPYLFKVIMKNNRYAPHRSLSLSEQVFVGASVRCRAAGLIPDKLVLLGVCPETGDGIC